MGLLGRTAAAVMGALVLESAIVTVVLESIEREIVPGVIAAARRLQCLLLLGAVASEPSRSRPKCTCRISKS
jgi:hypothetical protein